MTPRGLPGDPDTAERVRRAVRVDHAGEYGARRIYEGQLRVLGQTPVAPVLRHMAAQEAQHLHYFEEQLVRRRIRPSALYPLWHIGGYVLGAGTALLSQRAAMACTVAVEEVIDEHYARQREELPADEGDLKESIAHFQAEEVGHRDTGLAHEAEKAAAYPVLSLGIKALTRLAIRLAERV